MDFGQLIVQSHLNHIPLTFRWHSEHKKHKYRIHPPKTPPPVTHASTKSTNGHELVNIIRYVVLEEFEVHKRKSMT